MVPGCKRTAARRKRIFIIALRKVPSRLVVFVFGTPCQYSKAISRLRKAECGQNGKGDGHL
jgi:hypothetical protein